MASPQGYRWDSLGSGQGFRSTTTAWDLRWWILLAVLTSVVVHLGLFLVLKRIKSPAPRDVSAGLEQRTGPLEIEVDRISVPEEMLRDLSTEPADLTQATEREMVIDVPDIARIAEAVQDTDVTMTPAVNVPELSREMSTPAPGTSGDLLDDVADIRTAPSQDFKNSLLSQPSATREPASAADDRLTIDINDGALSGADMKNELMNAVKKGTGGNGGLDGFTNLDDLANYKGPINKDFKTMLPTDLLFDFGRAELRDSARLSLLKLGYIIQKNDTAVFRLVGHTDTIGEEAENQALSEARAQAVKDWLVGSLGLTGDNIQVEGRGEREPLPGVNSNGTPAQQALNRRVEIIKTKK